MGSIGKRALVAGGAGYIGSHVAKALHEAGYMVGVLDNLVTGSVRNLLPESQFFLADLSQKSDVEQVFDQFRPHCVIHLAAFKAAGESMATPSKYAENNISGSITLLNAALKFGKPRVVFSSSAAVYGIPKYVPLDEAHPTHPINFYGFTKLKIEEVLEWYWKIHGLEYAALRYFNAAGVDPTGTLLGLDPSSQNLIPLVMDAASGVRPELQVFGDDYETKDGTCLRDYVHVTDLAEMHVRALEVKRNEPLILNLGTEKPYSVLEVIHTAQRVIGHRVPHKVVGRRPGDPAVLYASCQRAEQTLGWSPKYSDLETILKTAWQARMQSLKN